MVKKVAGFLGELLVGGVVLYILTLLNIIEYGDTTWKIANFLVR